MSTASGRPLKPMLVRVAAAVLLVVAAEALRRTSAADDRMAAALETLSITSPEVAASEFGELEDSMGLVARVPLVGPALLHDVQYRRAEASYWAGNYAPLTAREAAGGEGEDPAMKFMAVNAMFRQLQGQRPNQNTAKALDDLLQRYLVVLQGDPGHVDAAYNYELISRLRDAASRGRFNGLQQQEEAASAQGDEGGPPPDTSPTEFNVIVPLAPDERRDQQDAGMGKGPARKG